jgi:hypothetical protein
VGREVLRDSVAIGEARRVQALVAVLLLFWVRQTIPGAESLAIRTANTAVQMANIANKMDITSDLTHSLAFCWRSSLRVVDTNSCSGMDFISTQAGGKGSTKVLRSSSGC